MCECDASETYKNLVGEIDLEEPNKRGNLLIII
jgi:hypothetical protein